jgi:hypothetical protein
MDVVSEAVPRLGPGHHQGYERVSSLGVLAGVAQRAHPVCVHAHTLLVWLGSYARRFPGVQAPSAERDETAGIRD